MWKSRLPKPISHFPRYHVTSVTIGKFEGRCDAWLTNWMKWYSIPRIILKPSSWQYPFLLKRCQFPVRLSFAMTINKAEVQSLKYVGIHLMSSIFCLGQLYVALSRTTSSQNLLILLPQSSNTKTTNIVYPEVLLEYISSSGFCYTPVCTVTYLCTAVAWVPRFITYCANYKVVQNVPC